MICRECALLESERRMKAPAFKMSLLTRVPIGGSGRSWTRLGRPAGLAGGVQTELGLMSPFGLDHSLSDFSATVRALVGEVDLRHAPMGLDVSYVHRKSQAVGTND
jgi:hypothetical protein